METLISLSRLQAVNVSNLRDSGRAFHLPPMTVQAELHSLTNPEKPLPPDRKLYARQSAKVSFPDMRLRSGLLMCFIL